MSMNCETNKDEQRIYLHIPEDINRFLKRLEPKCDRLKKRTKRRLYQAVERRSKYFCGDTEYRVRSLYRKDDKTLQERIKEIISRNIE